MTAILQEFTLISSIKQEIEYHPAWFGCITGLKAEKLLRGHKRPYLYILRAGECESENETDYYVSFVLPDYSIKHQPFTITMASEGWYYENMSGGGPFTEASIDDVLHLIMHCHKDENAPLIQFVKK